MSYSVESGVVLTDISSAEWNGYNAIIRESILNGNITGVSNFVLNATTIPFFVHKNRDLVALAYSNKQLESAEVLISNGATFNVKSLFLINNFSCEHITHINKIKPYISFTVFESAINLVEAYGCNNKLGDIVTMNRTSCVNVTQYMSNHTISNVRNDSFLQYYKYFQSESSFLVKEIMKGIVSLTYNNSKSFIIMPVGTRTYFEAVNIVIDGKPGYIYLPINDYDKTELSFTIHEFTHYLLRGLPEFNGRAYFDKNSKKEYAKAAKETLLNIFVTITKGKVSENDFNELVNNEKYDIKFVGEAISGNSGINKFIYLCNQNNDIINEILVNQYIGNTSLPALNRKIIYGNFLESIMNQSNISFEEGYVLARIAEFLKRPAEELDKELIVRLFELEIYGINSRTMEVFKPLYEYWSKYVSPKIQEVIKEFDIPFCTDEELYEIAPTGDFAQISQNQTEFAGNIPYN